METFKQDMQQLHYAYQQRDEMIETIREFSEELMADF